ncbi:MAG: hypothetical protein O7G85_12485 [Planctomycetota bacterium]|nr:hypothetical protein [Planctomycetota bacterium]
MSQPHIHRTSTVLLAILLGMCAMIANAMQQPPGFPPTSPPQTQPSTQPSTRPTMPA